MMQTGAVKDEGVFGSPVVCWFRSVWGDLALAKKENLMKSINFRLPHRGNLVK